MCSQGRDLLAGAGENGLDALQSTCLDTQPAQTTRTLWFSYPEGVDGCVLDVIKVDVDMEDSGMSGGVGRVCVRGIGVDGKVEGVC